MSWKDSLVSAFAEAYKREADQDESVWRSLPFFATSLTLYGAILGYVATKLPPITLSIFSIAAYILLAASATSLVISFGWLWYSVHSRRYRQIPLETDTLTFARGLEAYYGAVGRPDVDEVVKADLQNYWIDQFSAAVAHNRKLNESRLESRSYSIRFLLFGYVTLGIIVMGMFAGEKLHPIWVETIRSFC